ncbi:MAG: hypothetical protein JNK75_03470, partial [Betaproteobacteria bacterium]|nr:hypothetical protein [Betaproteobacteria bacterium]
MTAFDSFLHVTQSGRIWWRLEDAIKLGAGFEPISDASKQVAVLSASSNQQRVAERTLVAAVRKQFPNVEPPRTIERDGVVFIGAGGFLLWLGQYILESVSDIPFPAPLARAVSNAEAIHAGAEPYQPLSPQLAQWLDSPLENLPKPLRDKVSREIFPFTWEMLTPGQRQRWAAERDLQSDPALDGAHRFWFDFYCRKREIEEQIATWNSASVRDAADLATKEKRLAKLESELRALEAKAEKLAEKERRENAKLAVGDAVLEQKAGERAEFVSFPKAMKRLREEHDATVEELAIWVWLGAKGGGLTAYVHANELEEPQEFRFPPGIGRNFDFVGPLMGTDYRESDLANFKPRDRYISATKL